MEFQLEAIEGKTEEEIIELLNHNMKVAKIRQEEIRSLENATKPEEKEQTTIELFKEESSIISEIEEESSQKDFEEEVNYYLEDLRSLKQDELKEKFYEVLPVSKNYNYKKIILRLIAEMYRDIKEINEIIIESQNLSETEQKEYEGEKAAIEERIQYLKEALCEKKEILETKQHENTLIFVPTSSGNIRVIEELKSISSEYYDAFLNLFKSIKDGSFKNIKRFTNHETLRGTLEVKDFRIRIVFSRLSKNCYAIITAFIKKCDNDNGYRKPIEYKVAEYKSIQEKLKKNLETSEFMELQKEYEIELFKMLGENYEEEKGKEKKI